MTLILIVYSLHDTQEELLQMTILTCKRASLFFQTPYSNLYIIHTFFISNEKIFLQDFPEDRTKMFPSSSMHDDMLSICLNIQSHTSVLTFTKDLFLRE